MNERTTGYTVNANGTLRYNHRALQDALRAMPDDVDLSLARSPEYYAAIAKAMERELDTSKSRAEAARRLRDIATLYLAAACASAGMSRTMLYEGEAESFERIAQGLDASPDQG
jgi:hypothetical protein